MQANLFNIQKFSLHDGPGIRTTIFFQGCNLRCAWCANPESQPTLPPMLSGKPAGRIYSLEEVLEEALKDKPFYDQSGGGVTLSGGEALLQHAFAFALTDELQAQGVQVALETAACIGESIWHAACEKMDCILVDLKHWDEATHQRATGVPMLPIRRNIQYAIAHAKLVIPRIPIIPGVNDSIEDAQQFARLLTVWGANTVHILPFHQSGEEKYRRLGLPYAFDGAPQLHAEDLAPFANVLREAGLSVQIGG